MTPGYPNQCPSSSGMEIFWVHYSVSDTANSPESQPSRIAHFVMVVQYSLALYNLRSLLFLGQMEPLSNTLVGKCFLNHFHVPRKEMGVSLNLEEQMHWQKMVKMMKMTRTLMTSVRICYVKIIICPKINRNKKRQVHHKFRKVNQNIRKVTTEVVFMRNKVVGLRLILYVRMSSLPLSKNYQTIWQSGRILIPFLWQSYLTKMDVQVLLSLQ